jgi:hypothetical protein
MVNPSLQNNDGEIDPFFQFIDHDITHTPSHSELNCCDKDEISFPGEPKCNPVKEISAFKVLN